MKMSSDDKIILVAGIMLLVIMTLVFMLATYHIYYYGFDFNWEIKHAR